MVIKKYEEGISLSAYQMMHLVIQQTVGYWHHSLEEKKQGNGSKALAYEINTIYQLWQDFSEPKREERY